MPERYPPAEMTVGGYSYAASGAQNAMQGSSAAALFHVTEIDLFFLQSYNTGRRKESGRLRMC